MPTFAYSVRAALAELFPLSVKAVPSLKAYSFKFTLTDCVPYSVPFITEEISILIISVPS